MLIPQELQLSRFEAGCVNQRVNHECYCKRDLLQIKSTKEQ